MRLKKSKEEIRRIQELRRSGASGAVSSDKHYNRAREKRRVKENAKDNT